MSTVERKLVVTYILPREEDPGLFDHLICFRKGPARTGRLKSLVKGGFMHERFDARRAMPLQLQTNGSECLVAPTPSDAAVMDQIFTTVER
jgi:hypothetical protein